MLQGVDWMMVEEQINVNEKLDVALPGEEEARDWGSDSGWGKAGQQK